MHKDFRENKSGCYDPTAYKAIMRNDEERRKFHKALNALYKVCDSHGFIFEERIILKDKKTGKVWK